MIARFIFLSGAVNIIPREIQDRRFCVIESPVGQVRVRSISPDPFGGARGNDYIRLRGLAPKIGPLSRASGDDCQCGPCTQARLLPAVQAICDRRARPVHQGTVNWSDVHNEHAHDLLDVSPAIGR